MGGQISIDGQEAESLLFTRTGARIRVRAATVADAPLLADFFRQVSPDDLRFRFLTTLKEVDADRITALCVADYPRTLSFLAFADATPVAIATLAGDATGKIEVALSTLPDWKGRGVSWTLLDHAIRFARGHGAREIVSIEHGDNRAAIQLEHEMGFGIRLLDAGSGEVMAVKSIG